MNRLNRFSIYLVTGLCIGFVVIALTAPWIAPHNPEQGVLLDRLMPPVWLEGGSTTYLLGTDKLGRDVLSRLIYGAQISLTVCVLAIVLSGVVGSTLGIIAGYYGGWPERILMRLVDLTLSFPIILLALLFGVIYGPSFLNVIIVISLVLWSQYARMARGETLKIKTTDYVELARTAGATDFYIMRVHILPNIIGALIVLATLQVGTVIILESSLSFLGVGVPPPTPSWGSMIADGRSYIMSASWLSIVPGLSILLTVLSVNILGDHLNDILNPKTRMSASR